MSVYRRGNSDSQGSSGEKMNDGDNEDEDSNEGNSSYLYSSLRFM